jgi:tetratricopeptide (TPR) repeat protein
METAEVLAARLRSNPADYEAYEALKAFYRSHGDMASLVNLIAGWAGWVPDDRAASRAYMEVADVLSQQLGDLAQAETFYVEALRRDPLNVAASEAAQSLWESQGQHSRLAEYLQEHVQTLSRLGAPVKQLAVLRYRLGELWSKRFGRAHEALHHYRKAVELDPTLLRALYEARQLYLADGDLRSAAELYDREAAAETDPERRSILLLELAALYREELNDVDGAVSALERAHGAAPDDPSISYELATLLIQRAERADQRTARGDYAQMADLMCGIAASVDPAQAMTYLETALDYAPDHETALTGLERLLDGHADGELHLAKRWVAYVAAAPDASGAAPRRVALARAYVRQQQIEDAIFCVEPAANSGYEPAIALLRELRGTGDAHAPEPSKAFEEQNPSDPGPTLPPPRQRGRARKAASARAKPVTAEPVTAKPRSARPMAREASRDTTDMGDIQTQVGESDVIDSLREATVAAVSGTPRESFPRAEDTRETSPPPRRARAEVAAVEHRDGADDLVEELAREDLAIAAIPPALADAPPQPEAEPEPELEPEPEPTLPEARRETRPEPARALHAEPEPVRVSEPAPAPRSSRPTAEPLSDAELLELRTMAASLAREQRHDDAAATYERVLRVEPRDREAFAFLDAFYRRTQRYDRRAVLLEQSATTDGLPLHVRVTRMREAAGTYEARLKDYPAALRCFRVLAELEPQSEDVLRAQKRLLERAQQWDELARVLEIELSRTSDAEPKLPLLRKLATLHRDKRGDRDAAADALERMLMLRPDDRAARDALIEDLLAAERYDDVLPLLERKVEEASSKSQKLQLLREIAALSRDKIGDPNRAFAVYDRMLVLAPGDAETFAAMERLDESSGNFARLLVTLERQASAAGAAQAAAILTRMAQLAETKLDDIERASDLLSRAVDLAPDQPEPLRALCHLYERSERFDDLVELLRERVLIERNAEARAELHRRVAQVVGERLNDVDGAIDAWRKLLQIKEDREALLALQHHALAHDDAEQLVDILARLAALETDREQRRDLLFERASLLLARLKRPALAIADLVRVLTELDPDFEPAFDALEAASNAASDHRGLAQIVEQRLNRADAPHARGGYARRLSDLYEHELNDAERAIGALQRWAEADAEHPEPFRRLSPLLARARRYPELVAVLDALARLEPEADARQGAAITAAELAAGKLKDVDGAWHRLAPLVIEAVPAAVEAIIALAQNAKRFDALYDLLERAGQIDKLLALLRGRSAREQDTGVRATLLRRTAQLLVEYAQDEDGAAEAYRRLLEIEEDSDALRFLQSLALRRDDPNTLADVLKRLAALEPNVAERRDLLFEHARVLNQRLERAADAVPVLQQVLQQDPDYEPAYDELVRASETARDYATLAHTLERMLARTPERELRTQLAMRLADVCERELHEAARAIVALGLWAEADAGDPQPHRRLRPLLLAAQRERELLATLDALSRLEDDREAQIEATLAAAELSRIKLDDSDGAFRRLVPLLAEAHPRADRALLSLAVLTGRLDELYQLLERVNRHDTLVLWLRERVAAEPEPSARAALLRRMARTLAGPLDDDAGAEVAWAELLQFEEDVEALSFIRAQALQRDDAELLGQCLRRLSALEHDRGEKRDLLYEYGHLLRARLGRPAEAALVLREVIEQLDPDFEPALDELIDACEAVSDQRTLAWALEQVLRRERDPERQAETARRLARLCELGLGEPERAIGALRMWTQAAPAEVEPHKRLIALLTTTERFPELLAELDTLAELEDAAGRAAALLSGAALAFDRMRDADGAWRRLLLLANTGNERAEALLSRVSLEGGKTDELIALYEGAERYDDLIAVLRDQAERATEPATKAELYRRCARLLLGPIGDDVAAAEAYRELLSFAEDAEALRYLREQALRLDDPQELADLAGRLALQSSDRTERRDLLFERALLLSDRLEQPAQAIGVLRSIVLELDPHFGPAIEELVALAETAEDYANLALGLECQLTLTRDLGTRADIAERLATLYEDTLHDEARAHAALRAWNQAAPREPQPLRRLRTQIERAGAPRDLLGVLDALFACEETPEARIEAALAGAELCATALSDAQGAWQRLSPLVLARDARAERAAHALASQANLHRPLANAYVMRAQAANPQLAVHDWTQAAALYEQNLNEPNEALEAMLRALALDMQNRDLLGEIERIAARTQAWERVARVYAKLVQQAGTEEKIELLARHSALLEQHTGDAGAALERLLQVCKLAPQRKDLLERAAVLATRAQAHAELIWIHETLAQYAQSAEERVQCLVNAARVADVGLEDREHAVRDMTRALELTEQVPEMAALIEELARDLDKARPDLGRHDARRALIQAHMELAQKAGAPFGPSLVLRASQLLRDDLKDDSGCFDALKQGATWFPNDLDLYDALERAALKIKRFDALDAHLARCAQLASDRAVKRALLERRGTLLATHLQRHAKAAEVYRELLALDPDNVRAFDALRSSLRQSARYQELLKVYTDRLARTEELPSRLMLMREMAKLWEIELKNRPSAVELWRGVQALAPEDEEASAALSRLQT